MTLLGEQHIALAETLATWPIKDWAVTIVQGFPGTGKTEIALEVERQVRRTQPTLPVARFDCPQASTNLIDDFVFTLAEELADSGDRELLGRIESGDRSNDILRTVWTKSCLIIVDEAHRLLIGATRSLPEELAVIFERWSKATNPAGRIILLSHREFDSGRWTERVRRQTIRPFEPAVAQDFLRSELSNLPDLTVTIPAVRHADVVAWLGYNARAIRLLVRSLINDTLEDLIGLAPDTWEARDRPVSPDLLKEFETKVLARATDRLDADASRFLQRLAVLRRAVNNQGLEALCPERGAMKSLRDELLSRYILIHTTGFYDLHPVVHETLKVRMSGAEARQAHLAAGRYHAAPFRARQTLGSPSNLGGRFIEARYHFTMAESEQDLSEITIQFEAHFRATYTETSKVPTDARELDERIALLTALLQARGAKGLEYFLARCFVARNHAGDRERALPHARRATGPQAPEHAWLLRIRLEEEFSALREVVNIAREAIDYYPLSPRLYQAAAELLGRSGKADDAVALLREGIKVVPPAQNLFSLYQAAAEMLGRSGKADDAVALLREGIKVVPPAQNLFSLYQAAAEMLDRSGKVDDAIALLREGIKVIPAAYSVFSLYQATAEILDRSGKADDAIALLREGIKVVPAGDLFVLYLEAGSILNRQGREQDSIQFLAEGWTRLGGEHNSYRLVEEACLIAFAASTVADLAIPTWATPQQDLLAILAAAAMDDFARARDNGLSAIKKHPLYFPIYAQTAFATLCAGEPARIDDILKRFPRAIRHEEGASVTWLCALNSSMQNELEVAKNYTELYLNRRLTPGEMPNRQFLLQIWDNPSRSNNAAFHFPRLPPIVTGLTSSIVRKQSTGPIIPSGAVAQVGEQGDTLPQQPRAARSLFDPAQIVTAMRPDGWNGLYVVGCYDQLKTVYTQQCRSLTLIHALFEMGELSPGSRVAVIGGGAAGATAAAAAAHRGAKVVMYERNAHLFQFQRQNTTRYLHPHIYHWPHESAFNVDAMLPIMTWHAGLCGSVAKEMARGFEELFRATGRIGVRLESTISDILQLPSGNLQDRVKVVGNEGAINETVDLAVLAIGFGIERRHLFGVDTSPYWENDGLDQALEGSPGKRERILISGAGDGALVDLLRATLHDFQHEHILGLLPRDAAMRKIGEQLADWDNNYKRAASIGHSSIIDLNKAYGQLVLPTDFKNGLKAHVRSDTEVWFNFKEPERYTLESSLLNRLLVFSLCQLRAITPKLAELDEKMIVKDKAGTYTVYWPRVERPQEFDRILIRHGPPRDFVGSIFPKIHEASVSLRGKLRQLELTVTLDESTVKYFLEQPVTA